MKQPLLPSVGAAAGALLASSATLVCCVLPAVFVSLGAGATLAGLVTTFPSLVWLSERKSTVFGVAGFILALSAVLLWRARRLPCPTDPSAARMCDRLRRVSRRLFAIALAAYGAGFTFAFVLPAFTN